ncbi:MAG TPA: AsmA family protein, partial [Burkholderiales bacterium]|nr:AsmA family protein [Burkholderiales bacterium]
MQTTLLGLAIAIIIALVAALVGPSFIDWNQYKPQFEAEAARVVGARVRVEGVLDARLLPAPILRLHTVSVGAPNDATRMRADKLDVEFSLSSLMRGEWRATHLSLNGAALDLGLDQKGSIIAPSKGAFNFGALAIDKLDLTGRVKVHDAASGADYAVNDIVFSGDVRALGSNMRGEGSFAASDVRQPFRLVMSQTQDNKGTRIRIDLDPAKDGAVSGGIDGALTFDKRTPRFDGAVTLTRQGDMPWRVSAKTKAAPAGASFEQADIVYGSDETGLKLTGSGDVSFGKSPLLRASISAQQLDADRALSKGEAGSRAGIPAAMRALLAAMPSLPLSSQIDFSADQITFGGKPVQGMTAKLRGASDAWTINKFDLTAPGTSRLTVSGVI